MAGRDSFQLNEFVAGRGGRVREDIFTPPPHPPRLNAAQEPPGAPEILPTGRLAHQAVYSLPITRNWKTGVCNYSNYSCNYNTAVITATETRHGRADAY